MTIDIVIILLLLAVLLLLRRLQHRLHELGREQGEMQRTLFNQFESYHFLRDRLNLHDGLPYTHDWSAAPDFLKLIAEHCLEHRPQTIVECSSGLTTLVMARCCELNGAGRVYSLENGEEFATKSRGHLERYGLTERATVIHAPLQHYQLGGRDYQWYALERLPENSIDMLVIDGPPGFIQRHSRYPALPLLFDKLADGCVIFLDDAARPDEQELVGWWLTQFPGLGQHSVTCERGCACLTLKLGDGD